MKKEINLNEVKGKTIEDFACPVPKERFIITFTDNTFAVLGGNMIDIEYYDKKSFDKLDISRGEYECLIHMEIMTKEDYEELIKASNDLMKDKQEKADRRQYEKLKKRFSC